MRATSKRLCFMASMALSNSTLSGCFDPTFASGLTAFLLVQATVNISSTPETATSEIRRDIKTSIFLRGDSIFEMWGQPPPRARRAKLGTFHLTAESAVLDFQKSRFRRSFQQRHGILHWIT